jgi:hypothetical protein
MARITPARIIRQMERHKAVVAAERDKLRDLRADMDALDDSFSSAIEALDTAIDALSQYA